MSMPYLYPVDTSNTSMLVTTKTASILCQMYPKEQNCLLLITTELERKLLEGNKNKFYLLLRGWAFFTFKSANLFPLLDSSNTQEKTERGEKMNLK